MSARILLADVRDAIEVLERLADDWTLFEQLSPADRERLHRAISRAYEPDRRARRKRARTRRAEHLKRDDGLLHTTGIRSLRRTAKTTRHPHTNMAKAALNMMTRTSATDYHNDGIHMNSVDTGWITDEDPEEIAARKTVEQRFHPPLDVVDGAARILDPIISGVNTGVHVWGQFLKNYKPTDW